MEETFEFPVNTPTDRFQALRGIVNLLGQRGYANPADALEFSYKLNAAHTLMGFGSQRQEFDSAVIGATERLLSLHNIRWATRKGLDGNVVLIAVFRVQVNHFVQVAQEKFSYTNDLESFIAGGR